MALVLPSRNTLGETVTNLLRSAILDGSIKLGQPLHENTLAREMSVSRSPIREALIQLERENLLVSRLNRPAFVRRPSPEEIKQVYTLRSSLEGIAARWTAERATPALVALLDEKAETLNRATKAAERDASPRAVGLALEFHAAITEASGSPELQRLLQSLCNQIQLVMATGLASFTKHRADDVHTEHMAIIAAIAAKDGDRAEHLAIAHVRGGRDRLILLRVDESDGHRSTDV